MTLAVVIFMVLSFLLGMFLGWQQAARAYRKLYSNMIVELHDLLRTEQAKKEFREAIQESVITHIRLVIARGGTLR